MRYDAALTETAWQRTLAFFKQHLAISRQHLA